MRWAALFGLVGIACTGSPPPAEPAAPAPPAPPPATTETLPPDEPAWDPGTPVDESELDTRRLFVIVPRTSVCPTQEQARARECGNSVEDPNRGAVAPQGRAITCVGTAPRDGFWKALRYTKAGVLPGWVLASDVAVKPSTEFLDAWASRADVGKAEEVTDATSADLTKLAAGTLAKWPRSLSVQHGAFGDAVRLFVDQPEKTTAAVELPLAWARPDYVMHHDCLMQGDCLRLAYLCGESYCDEVSILARATGKTIEAPSDPTGWWSTSETRLPLFEAVAVADRFGLFAAGPTPTSK